MTVIHWSILVLALIIVGGALFVTFGLYRLSRTQPETSEVPLGETEGKLRPCPDTPNCVSTQADPHDETHYAEPIPYRGSRDDVLGRLAVWIEDQPGAQVVTRRNEYLRAVFASKLFGFKDDVEVYAPEDEKVLHLRSASRVGRGDMGVNRRRYQAIRDLVERMDEH
jgi:uncharacterized protein (DUF1499 family)